MTADNEVTVLQRFSWVANTIYHALLGIVTFFIFWVVLKNNDSGNTLSHIMWSTVAYVPLMAEGIILFSDSNSWTQYIKRTTKYYIHGACLLTSTITVTVGCIYIIIQKRSTNAQHFETDHAITGLVSWVICLACVLLGLATAYSQKLKRILSPVILKLLHNFLGLSAYLIGIASLILGLDKGRFARFVADEELVATKWLLSIAVIYSCYEACISMYHQVKAVVS